MSADLQNVIKQGAGMVFSRSSLPIALFLLHLFCGMAVHGVAAFVKLLVEQRRCGGRLL